MRFLGTSFILAILLVLSCRSTGGVLLLPTPDARMKDTAQYFGHEYARVLERRHYFNRKDAEQFHGNLIGLALSGGGIRSNAFQLGLLSGLQQSIGDEGSGPARLRLLNYVDYVSSVSGGSWANGAYKNIKKTDTTMFDLIDGQIQELGVESGHSKPEGTYLVPNTYIPTVWDWFLNLITFRGASLSVSWNDEIRKYYLDDSHRNLANMEHDSPMRPYAIFNGAFNIKGIPTSNEVREKALPFEFTSDYVGAPADCAKMEYAGDCMGEELRGGVFTRTKDASILEGFFNERKPIEVSHAMAISSAVERTILGRSIEIPEDESASSDYRSEFFVSDGGHGDNLGVLSLLERKVNLIIVSDAGRDTEYTFDDLVVLKSMAKRLLKLTIEPVDPDATRYYFSNNMLSFPVLVRNEKGERVADIIYIKSKYFSDLNRDLKKANPSLYRYMLNHFKNFPNDATFTVGFNTQLV